MADKVDLQCCSCYKDINKLLLKFPVIKCQNYDEKTITVVSSEPEKIRDKLCCEVIKCIEIKEEKKADPPKPKENIYLVPIPVPLCPRPAYVFGACSGPCFRGCGGGPCHHGCGRPVPCCEQHDCYADGCSCGCGGRGYCTSRYG